MTAVSHTRDTTRTLPADEGGRFGSPAGPGVSAPTAQICTPPAHEDGWQYLAVRAEWPEVLDEAVIVPVSVVLSEALVEHGLDGWELATVVSESRTRTYIFRRPGS